MEAYICSMPKDKGLCLAYLPRWWYNKTIAKCQAFIYGGCLGNNNNFQTESVCMASCYKRTPNVLSKVLCEAFYL
ncbi:PREDICTED: eppin-like [Elephantulus edwardii]|uniref:eppin-like n=1 Tax=Elephantulus edwardii TaxID=28737 RepID=UPI0003F0AF4A|nr:PREDICTED: eppin-like [Elephantulus edwardii]